MAARVVSLADLADDDRDVVESWLLEFDREWHPSRLAEQIKKLPPRHSPLRLPALHELIKIDMERQWQHGREVRVEAYLRTYRELGNAETVCPDLILKEYEARVANGAPCDETTFFDRFPHQAAELHRKLKDLEICELRWPGPGHSVDTRNGQLGRPTPVPGSEVISELPEQFGRYRIRKRLGQGGMGSVYLARDTQLDRYVALKVPKLTESESGEFLQRFYREAKAAATLHHPNICPIYDAGQENNIPYLTMAYVEGYPLSQVLEHGRPLSQRTIAELVRKIALALREAHAKGIVHRDLKPSNIMITKRGEPVIMDFGLALRLDAASKRMTQAGTAVGTPAYMPPEQMEGATTDIGPASDVYSLGVVLYELLAGQLPFQGSAIAVCVQILKENPPPPSTKRPDLDQQLEAICLKAMSKQAKDRYSTMAEMAAELSKYLRGERAETTGPLWRLRQPTMPVLAGIACVITAVVVAGIGLFWPAPRPEISAESIKVVEAADLSKKINAPETKAEPERAKDSPTPPKAPLTIPSPPRPIDIPLPLRPRGFTNSIGMKMIAISPGTFMMGSAASDSESPPHPVTISRPFYLAANKTTQTEFTRVLGRNPSFYSASGKGKDAVAGVATGRFPVETITYYDAIEFCIKLSQREHRRPCYRFANVKLDAEGSIHIANVLVFPDATGYRLPSEAEWEYCARAGTTTNFAGGDDEAHLAAYAWYKANSNNQPHPVGEKMPNQWGLYDLGGLAWEWCEDNWHPNYNGAPIDGSVWTGGDQGQRVLRGGAWRFSAGVCRPAFRRSAQPWQRANFRSFRVVLAAAEAGEPSRDKTASNAGTPLQQAEASNKETAKDARGTHSQGTEKAAKPHPVRPRVLRNLPK
jgi:serine/threonine protein kinase